MDKTVHRYNRRSFPFSMGNNGEVEFHDYYTGEIIPNYEGVFYVRGNIREKMKTWIDRESGERAFSSC